MWVVKKIFMRFCCRRLRFVARTTAAVQRSSSMISNHHYTARNFHRVALRYIHVPIDRSDAVKRRVTQHLLANANERKNWCDTHDSRAGCRDKTSREWELLLFEEIPGNVPRKNIWPALRFVFDDNQLTMWNSQWR